jgi:hypothetical protein
MGKIEWSGAEGKVYTVVLTVTFFLNIKTAIAATTTTPISAPITMSKMFEDTDEGGNGQR